MKRLVFLLMLMLPSNVLASPDYGKWADDVHQRRVETEAYHANVAMEKRMEEFEFQQSRERVRAKMAAQEMDMRLRVLELKNAQ